MRNKGLFFIFIIILIFFILSILFLGKNIFLIKSIIITKDFNIENSKIIDYLEIYPLKTIWKYSSVKLQKKLSKLYYLEEYNIIKRYPDTLEVNIKIRKSIAKIVGIKENIYVIDKNGVIFRLADNTDKDLPVILMGIRDSIKPGLKLRSDYLELVYQLNDLKNQNKDIYNSISQIEITSRNKYCLDYVVMFKTLKQRIYLKNKINVDSIRKGLSCSLYLQDQANNNKLYFTKNGFVLFE